MSNYIPVSQSLTSNVKKIENRANECFATLCVMEKRFHFDFLAIFSACHTAQSHSTLPWCMLLILQIRLCFTYALYVCIMDFVVGGHIESYCMYRNIFATENGTHTCDRWSWQNTTRRFSQFKYKQVLVSSFLSINFLLQPSMDFKSVSFF